jgi:hypothetical protein
MKKFFIYLVSGLIFFSCEDEYESVYTNEYSTYMDYPVYYDASDILVDIQVTPPGNPVLPYKIASNDKYLFVGEMMKGIHVYERTGYHTDRLLPLCFIECKFSKAFDIIDDILFCNNFTDMLVIDVSNPQHATIIHRQKNHFNNYHSYATDWSFPYKESEGYVVDYKSFRVIISSTGEITDPVFSEADNMFLKEMPLSLINNAEKGKPYVGIVKYGKEIYTFGRLSSWAICTFDGKFNVTEKSYWEYQEKGFPFISFSYDPFYKLFIRDGFINVINTNNIFSGGFNNDRVNYFLFDNETPIDITVNTQNFFFILTKNSIRKTFIDYDYNEHKSEYKIKPGAVAITCAQDKIIILGDKLIVYDDTDSKLTIVKEYPDIAGFCMEKDNDVLTIASSKGVFFYDISDVNDIKIIP